jgi:hypothetical protein
MAEEEGPKGEMGHHNVCLPVLQCLAPYRIIYLPLTRCRPILGILAGLGLSAWLILQGLQSVHNPELCPVYISDFSRGLDMDVWTKEVEVGGFGNGQFEETTNTDENAFVQGGLLHLRPTLQDPELITTNNTINLLKDGTCSSTLWSNCVATTNTTNGTIVNPVKSARISTKKGATIKYGRIEVEAKLPTGDWLWPAIWMMPVKDTYGPWPASGEIGESFIAPI